MKTKKKIYTTLPKLHLQFITGWNTFFEVLNFLILKTNNDEIRKCTYFTALDNCDQDVVDTLCKTDHALCEMKKGFADLQTLHWLSDNAWNCWNYWN